MIFIFVWFFFPFFFFNFLNFKVFNSYMRSQTWTPLPPPSPQHLSGSSPCTSPKHAAPYVRHGLAIQFLHDSKHFLMKTNSDLYFGLSIMDNFKFFLFFQIKFKLTLTQWISCYLFYFWKLNNYAANFYAVCCEFNFSFTFLIPFT